MKDVLMRMEAIRSQLDSMCYTIQKRMDDQDQHQARQIIQDNLGMPKIQLITKIAGALYLSKFAAETLLNNCFTLAEKRDLSDFKLCYISDDLVFFTTQDLGNQTGDDWGNRPYEHNAGIPYSGDSWEILYVRFKTCMKEPRHRAINSHYSVDDINNQQVPWLTTTGLYVHEPVNIYAGASIREFVEGVEKVDGCILLPATYEQLEEKKND